MKSTFFKWNHLLVFSPWPLCLSISIFSLLVRRVYSWHTGYFVFFFLSIFFIVLVSFCWFSDIIYENFLGFHNRYVSRGFSYGMILFIMSEVLFFFSFFWAYFHNLFSPSTELGVLWPPFGFSKIIVDPFSIPLLNTVLLLSSGVTVTCSHHRLIKSNYKRFIFNLLSTIILGLIFLFLQFSEYLHCCVRFNSTIYGSTFYILTGFHGLHVTLGVLMLLVCLFRGISYHFSNHSHTGYLLTIWYWHFVDVVWLFLYIFLYWYGL